MTTDWEVVAVLFLVEKDGMMLPSISHSQPTFHEFPISYKTMQRAPTHCTHLFFGAHLHVCTSQNQKKERKKVVTEENQEPSWHDLLPIHNGQRWKV